MTSSGGGIDPTTINPPDAVAALRSFPRRWRSALGVIADDPAADDLVRRRAGGSPSTLEHAWEVAALLRSTDEQIHRTRREDKPTLSGPGGGGEDGGLEAALAAIGERAPALATTLEQLGPDEWRRSARVDGRDVTILALAQHAVADASHGLRAAERALRAARGAR